MTRQSVLLLLVLALLIHGCGEEKKPLKGERVFSVKTVPVQLGEFFIKFRTSGFFEPVHSVKVKPEVSGKVVKLLAEEGDRVEKGSLLLKLDDSLYRKSYEEALWRLEEAKRELENIKAVYLRRKKLFEKELISREEFEEVRTKLDTLRARVENLKALLDKRRIELSKTELRSPIEGFVLRRMTELGDYLTPQRDAYELVKVSPLRFVFKMPQETAGVLKAGKSIIIEHDGGRMEARVTYVSASADGSRLFTVKALVENERGVLKPGTYGEVSFDYRKVKAVSLPEQAVQLSQRHSFVWVVREGRAVKVPVEVISHGEGKVLVRGNFRKGDRVIVEGLLFLYEGAKVSEG